MEPILRWLKRVGLLAAAIVVGAYVLLWAYSLPRHEKVRVTGTEVTRQDVELPSGEIRTHDVRYVTAESLDGEPRMYRNEDTGWGWPLYFKFDSGDVTARANALANEPRDTVVLATYYGFRIRMFSMFPNLLSLEKVAADHEPIPWLVGLVVLGHAVLIGVAITAVRAYRQDLGPEAERARRRG